MLKKRLGENQIMSQELWTVNAFSTPEPSPCREKQKSPGLENVLLAEAERPRLFRMQDLGILGLHKSIS